MAVLETLNNYLHDFSAAMWFAALLTGYLLRRAAREKPDAGMTAVLTRVFGKFSLVFYLSLAVIAVTGAIRVALMGPVTPAGRAVIGVKHAVFMVIVAAGVAAWIRMKRQFRSQAEEAS